jgi:hypothetical protein
VLSTGLPARGAGPADEEGEEEEDGEGEVDGAGAGVAPAGSATAGALVAGAQAAAMVSEKMVPTPTAASSASPPATSALVRSPVVLCLAPGWSAIRGTVHRQRTDEESNMRRKHSIRRQSVRQVAPKLTLALALTVGLALPAPAGAAGPKYFFQLREVKAGPEVGADLKSYAGEALKADLAGRPEWASDISAADPQALVAELAKRKLRGFDVTVRFEDLRREVRPPKPGGRLKQLAVNVRLTVFGTTVAEEKLAFSGEGEAGLEAEVSDKRVEAETTSLTRDAIKDAVKQAVDQAVLKLSVAATQRGGSHGKPRRSK